MMVPHQGSGSKWSGWVRVRAGDGTGEEEQDQAAPGEERVGGDGGVGRGERMFVGLPWMQRLKRWSWVV
jgi:hypothetical protein